MNFFSFLLHCQVYLCNICKKIVLLKIALLTSKSKLSYSQKFHAMGYNIHIQMAHYFAPIKPSLTFQSLDRYIRSISTCHAPHTKWCPKNKSTGKLRTWSLYHVNVVFTQNVLQQFPSVLTHNLRDSRHNTIKVPWYATKLFHKSPKINFFLWISCTIHIH